MILVMLSAVNISASAWSDYDDYDDEYYDYDYDYDYDDDYDDYDDYEDDISKAQITLSKTSYEYNGDKKEPSVTVKINGETLWEDYDYEVTYSNNVNVGTAKVKIVGIDDYSGTVTKTFKITRKKVKNVNIYNVTYSGKAKYPEVWVKQMIYDKYEESYYAGYVKAKRGRDYTITFSGRGKTLKNIGKYTAKITFKGNYTGTIKKTVKVLPGSTNVKVKKRTTSSASFSWSKVKGVDGYKIYRWDSKSSKYKFIKTTKSTSVSLNRKYSSDSDIGIQIAAYKKVNGKTYYGYSYGYAELSPEKPTFTISRTDFHDFDINLKKKSNYQIQISTNSSFSNIVHTNQISYTNVINCTNFTSGTKYYVRLREYKYINNKLKVSSWSSAKTVTPW